MPLIILSVEFMTAELVSIPVNASSVSVPDINIDTGNWLASVDINVLNLKVEVNTLTVQVLLHILADDLASNVVWSVGNLGGQDRTSVGTEDEVFRCVKAIVGKASLVVVDDFIFFECGKIAAVLL